MNLLHELMTERHGLDSALYLLHNFSKYLPDWEELTIKVPLVKENKAFKRSFEKYPILDYLKDRTRGEPYFLDYSTEYIEIDAKAIMFELLRISKGEKYARCDLFQIISPVLSNMPGFHNLTDLIFQFLTGELNFTQPQFEGLFSLLLSWWYISEISKIKNKD